MLKELEDLGLKLKDLEKGAGINLKYCTVLSPYLVRYIQQIINKLKGVTDNISNKETKLEIQRALNSVEETKREQDEMILSIASYSIEQFKDKQSELEELLDKKNEERL